MTWCTRWTKETGSIWPRSSSGAQKKMAPAFQHLNTHQLSRALETTICQLQFAILGDRGLAVPETTVAHSSWRLPQFAYAMTGAMNAPIHSLFITLKRSFAGTREHHVRILQSLGFRYRQQTVEKPNAAHVRGAIDKASAAPSLQ